MYLQAGRLGQKQYGIVTPPQPQCSQLRLREGQFRNEKIQPEYCHEYGDSQD